jgi:hypothetical protein
MSQSSGQPGQWQEGLRPVEVAKIRKTPADGPVVFRDQTYAVPVVGCLAVVWVVGLGLLASVIVEQPGWKWGAEADQTQAGIVALIIGGAIVCVALLLTIIFFRTFHYGVTFSSRGLQAVGKRNLEIKWSQMTNVICVITKDNRNPDPNHSLDGLTTVPTAWICFNMKDEELYDSADIKPFQTELLYVPGYVIAFRVALGFLGSPLTKHRIALIDALLTRYSRFRFNYKGVFSVAKEAIRPWYDAEDTALKNQPKTIRG